MMPCDYSKYPANWREISNRIKERDGHKCKTCGLAHGAVGYRNLEGEFVELEPLFYSPGEIYDATCEGGFKVIRIVLTVAHHPDPDPMNCNDENLHSLCQQCHNRLDMPRRQANAAETRLRKKQSQARELGQLELISP